MTVCPTEAHSDETLTSLHFATRVRNITNTAGPARKNTGLSGVKNLEENVKTLQNDLKDARKKKMAAEDAAAELRRELKKAQEKVAAQADARQRAAEEGKARAERAESGAAAAAAAEREKERERADKAQRAWQVRDI